MGTAASYPRSVKFLSRCAGRSPRVYYSSMWLTLMLLALSVVPSPRAIAQVELTWSPSMVKGPSGAPVTIVEFSDYQ
jgi:hypothetical protein